MHKSVSLMRLFGHVYLLVPITKPLARWPGQTRRDTCTQKWDETHMMKNNTPVQCSTHWWQMSVTYSGMCVESYPRDTILFRLIQPQCSLFGLSENQMWCVTAKLAITYVTSYTVHTLCKSSVVKSKSAFLCWSKIWD